MLSDFQDGGLSTWLTAFEEVSSSQISVNFKDILNQKTVLNED